METALIQKAIDQQMAAMGDDADPVTAQALAYAELAENSKGMRLLNRYAKDLRRSYEKALTEFIELHIGDLAKPPEAHEAQAAPDYSILRNEPGYSSPAFIKAIEPYVRKQQPPVEAKSPMRNAA